MSNSLRSFGVIPFATLSPEGCAHLAARGRATLEVLDQWRIGRKVANRLHDAIGRLERVSVSGSFGEDGEALVATVDAIALTVDFFQIAQCLNGDPMSLVTAELSRAIDARIGISGRRRAKEYLTQYWATMVMASTHIEPRLIPPGSHGKRPDFVLDVGGLDVAIEVKRPEHANSARDALDRAAGQLRDFGRPGFIFLDLTDCVVSDDVRIEATNRRIAIAKQVEARFRGLATGLANRPIKYNQSDKYRRILGVAFYARLVGWQYYPTLQPSGEISLQIPLYEGACEGLVTEQSKLLKRLVLQGIEVVNGSPPQLAQ